MAQEVEISLYLAEITSFNNNNKIRWLKFRQHQHTVDIRVRIVLNLDESTRLKYPQIECYFQKLAC
jgi:hypothetical protein